MLTCGLWPDNDLFLVFFSGEVESLLLTGLHELPLASEHLGEGGVAAGEGVLHGCSRRRGDERKGGRDGGRSATLRHVRVG